MEATSPNKERVIMNFQEFIAQDDKPVKPMEDVVGSEDGAVEVTPEVPAEPVTPEENPEAQETQEEPIVSEEPEAK